MNKQTLLTILAILFSGAAIIVALEVVRNKQENNPSGGPPTAAINPTPIDDNYFDGYELPPPPTQQPSPLEKVTVEALLNGTLSLDSRIKPFDPYIRDITLNNGVGSVYTCETDTTYPQKLSASCDTEGIKRQISFSGVVLFSKTFQPFSYASDLYYHAAALMTYTQENTEIQYVVLMASAYVDKISAHVAFELPHEMHFDTIKIDTDTNTVMASGYRRATHETATKAFAFEPIRHGGVRLVSLSESGDKEFYEDNYSSQTTHPPFELHYPATLTNSTYGLFQSAGTRDFSTQHNTGYIPVYFHTHCNLEPTLADRSVTLTRSTPSFSAHVTVHKILSPTVFLSSSYYGYDPTDWGKVSDGISIVQYVSDIKTGTAITGKDVELITIASTPVRHILPYHQGRPCDGKSYEQYQFVKDDMIVNILFTEPDANPYDKKEKSDFVETVVETFQKSEDI